MARRRVSLVLRESILGIPPIEPAHLLIARDFRENRSGAYLRNEPIATHDRAHRIAQFRQTIAVYEDQVGLAAQPLYRPAHRQQSGLQDIEGIDLHYVGSPDAPCE